MTKSELRIGNIIKGHFEDYTFVESIAPDNVVGINRRNGKREIFSMHGDILIPVTLTEEWLLKLGFEDNGYGGYEKSWKPSMYTDIYVTYRVGRGMNDIGFSIWEHGYEIKNGIEYVHQLQNGWHFLTRGEELTINGTV